MQARQTSFVWLTGHVRNVGDSVLRRPYLAAISTQTPVQVYPGPDSAGYIDGLDLPAESQSASLASWGWKFVRASVTGRPNFVFNAGEFSVTKEYFFGLVALLPFIAIARAKGGKVIWVGAGTSKVRQGFAWPFRLLARWSDLLRWRDDTASALLRHAPSMPDWAFGIRPAMPIDSPRDYLAVSLRGDRLAPSEQWVRSVRALADRLSLRLVVVTQVEDDHVSGAALAARLSAEFVGWTHANHSQQEQLARVWYRKSRLVLSDRLHALIMASTEGVIPLGWVEHQTSKIRRHFAVIGADWVSVSPTEASTALDELTGQRVAHLANESCARTEGAYAAVQQVVIEIARTLK